jgi:hypothetical protein
MFFTEGRSGWPSLGGANAGVWPKVVAKVWPGASKSLGTTVHKYRSIMARMPFGWAGMMPSSLPRVLAMCAAIAVLASGCSPEIAFPAIHDMPPPRADTPLSPDQVKQATDGLISDRNHLSTETQAAVAATAAADAPPPAQTAAASAAAAN